MSVLQNLAVSTLSLRGKGNNFNKFSRFFTSLDEARASVDEGDYVPVAGVNNAVLVLGQGIMIWSFQLEDFVLIENFQAIGNQSSRYIELDGANDYANLATRAQGSENALDWSKSWSIGITLVGVQPGSDNKWLSLFSSGGNHVTLRRGGTNWGIYVTSNNNSYQHGANTWVAPSDTSRILLTYDHTTYRLKYYLGEPSTGQYAMRANLLVNSTVRTGNNPAGELNIGKGVGTGTYDPHHWDGGINNLLISNTVFSGPMVDEFFQTGEEFNTHEFYPDWTSWCKLGEDAYPSIVDQKANISGGVLQNGTSDDFKDIPTE